MTNEIIVFICLGVYILVAPMVSGVVSLLIDEDIMSERLDTQLVALAWPFLIPAWIIHKISYSIAAGIAYVVKGGAK